MNIKLLPRLALIIKQMVVDVKTHYIMKNRMGKGRWWDQVFEQWSLLWSNGVTADDYYLYGLYQYKTIEKKRHFLGYYERWRWMRQVNPAKYHILTEDKYVFSHYLRSHNIPVAKVYGIYGPNRGISVEGQLLKTPQQLLEWLNKNVIENIFIKPTTGTRGANVLSLGRRLDENRWQRLPNGEVSAEEISQHLQRLDHLPNYIIEERLKPHPELAKYADNILHTARLVTSCSETVDIHIGTMRLALGDKPVDNRALGGIACVIDLPTGILNQGCLIKNGMCYFIDQHPISKQLITGNKIPDWQKACELVKRAAEIMCVNGLLAWDVALTDKGPVIIEANEIFDLHWQATANKGLLDTSLQDYFKEKKLLNHIGFFWH